jgi:hypothetical protein
MSLITLASIKGSPGVTTLACLVGATWPAGRRVMVAECDSDGGDLASRFSLSAKTGWQSLALAARRGDASGSIEDHLQNLPGGLEVLVGTQGGVSDGARRGAGQEAAHIVCEIAESPNSDVIIDLGRLKLESSETQMWLNHSATVCIVLRSDAASIAHARDRAGTVRELCGGRLLLAVVTAGPYSVPEIERFTGVTDIIEVADDPSAAAVLTAGRGSERRLTRSALVKSARRLVMTLAGSEPEAPAHGEADVTSLADESSTTKAGAQTWDRSLTLQDQQ